MADRLRVHPTHPQPRLLQQAAERVARGELALVPTDAGYVFAWGIDARDAEERVQRLRRLDSKHPFTLLCNAISEISSLARSKKTALNVTPAAAMPQTRPKMVQPSAPGSRVSVKAV